MGREDETRKEAWRNRIRKKVFRSRAKKVDAVTKVSSANSGKGESSQAGAMSIASSAASGAAGEFVMPQPSSAAQVARALSLEERELILEDAKIQIETSIAAMSLPAEERGSKMREALRRMGDIAQKMAGLRQRL